MLIGFRSTGCQAARLSCQEDGWASLAGGGGWHSHGQCSGRITISGTTGILRLIGVDFEVSEHKSCLPFPRLPYARPLIRSSAGELIILLELMTEFPICGDRQPLPERRGAESDLMLISPACLACPESYAK